MPSFPPVDYLEVVTPINSRVAVNTHGFYVSNVHPSIVLLELPIVLQKKLTVTASYLFVNLPPAGLDLLTQSIAYSSYREHQFRLASSVCLLAWIHFRRPQYVRAALHADE